MSSRQLRPRTVRGEGGSQSAATTADGAQAAGGKGGACGIKQSVQRANRRSVSRHCMRYHVQFMEADNHDEACLVEHDYDSFLRGRVS